jgi:DNA-directed RNA polymerase specialized sigma24 family protein
VALFPDTHYSVVAALRSTDAPTRTRAAEAVARVYRAPIIAVLRHRWQLEPADAEDLAHDFLAHALARDWLQRYDPSRGRFRTFLRSCLMAFASTAHEGATRLKRGGGAVHVPLDAASEAASSNETVDALFEREWVRSVFERSLESLRRECDELGRQVTYQVFVAYDVDGADQDPRPNYAQLAARFDIPVTQVTNYLNWARRALRVHVLETLRTLTTDEAEFRAEARALLGVDPP